MILAALLAAVASALLVVFLAKIFGPGGSLDWAEKVKKRIAHSHGAQHHMDPSHLRIKDNLSNIELFQKLLHRYAVSEKIAVSLKTIKSKISVSVFLLSCFVLWACSFLLLRLWMKPLLSFLLSLFIAALPFLYLAYRRRRYLAKFAEHLPNALSIISSAIKSGHSLEASIDAVARTAPFPVSEEFKVVEAEIKLSVPLRKALDDLYERIKNPDLKILITGVSIHLELGGNFSEILDNLEKTIRERFAMLREIHALSSQGRYSSWVLSAIPVVLVGLYATNDPETFMQFVSSSMGSTVIAITLLLDLTGFVWMRQIVRLRD